jgi:hypothetical protein
VAVGVPVGTPAFITAHMRKALFDPAMWRLARQLPGVMLTSPQAAFRIFHSSLAVRFGFLARNVDPSLARPWLAGYDTMCAWTLEQMLHLDGSPPVAELQTFLKTSCDAGDADAVAHGGPITLGALGLHGSLQSVGTPLVIARLPQRLGGFALPQLHITCRAAFAACSAEHLQTAALSLQRHLPAVTNDSPHAATLPAYFRELRYQLRVWRKFAAANATTAAGEARQLLSDAAAMGASDDTAAALGVVAMEQDEGGAAGELTTDEDVPPPTAALQQLIPDSILQWSAETVPASQSLVAAWSAALRAQPCPALVRRPEGGGAGGRDKRAPTGGAGTPAPAPSARTHDTHHVHAMARPA